MNTHIRFLSSLAGLFLLSGCLTNQPWEPMSPSTLAARSISPSHSYPSGGRVMQGSSAGQINWQIPKARRYSRYSGTSRTRRRSIYSAPQPDLPPLPKSGSEIAPINPLFPQ